MLGGFGLTGCLSATAMVRPAICFVKPQTTTCSAFLLGQAQDVDFHCTGFRLSALGRFSSAESAGLHRGRAVGYPAGWASRSSLPSRLNSVSLFPNKTGIWDGWHPLCSIASQRLKVSTPRSESGGDNLPI